MRFWIPMSWEKEQRNHDFFQAGADEYRREAGDSLDTPGHADFSAEMERTLQVLDYAVLVISGPDGVQGQVRTLWTLLDRYRIPVFLFVNKMDQRGRTGRRFFGD